MKNIIPLTIVLFTALVSCKSDVSVEDRLYSCLHDKFAAKSINLEKTLDTLEVLFINEGLLKSTSSNDYRHYYQTNIDTGMVLTLHDDYLIKLSKKIKLSLNDLEHCAFSEIDSIQLDQSKYG